LKVVPDEIVLDCLTDPNELYPDYHWIEVTTLNDSPLEKRWLRGIRNENN
jgi:hypothetical protein